MQFFLWLEYKNKIRIMHFNCVENRKPIKMDQFLPNLVSNCWPNYFYCGLKALENKFKLGLRINEKF